ncbi:ATP binding protein [Aureococcus anophagefferens]|nr:ATP binding protein [Aureococcus anophagefferens]
MAALYGGWRVVDGSLETVWDASAFRRSARAGPGTRASLGAGAAVAGAGRSVSVGVGQRPWQALASDAYAALVRRRLVGLHVAAGCAVADAPAADAPAAGPAAAALAAWRRRRRFAAARPGAGVNCYPSRRRLTSVCAELVAVPWLADLASDPERREIPEGALIHGPAGAGKTFACAAAARLAGGPPALRLCVPRRSCPPVEPASTSPRSRGTVNYVAGDLRRLADAAARAAADRDKPELQSAPSGQAGAVESPSAAQREGPPPPASAADLAAAAAEVPPSGLAAFAVEVPKTSWAGAGGQAEKRALQQAVIWPVTRRAEFDRFGIRACRGVLLHGPPGCSKTLLARATASESSCAFIALSGADVYSPYLGEAEATVRRAFAAADAATPCILFFDEIDALVCDRAGRDGRGAEARVLGVPQLPGGASGGPRDGVVTLGATNRSHAIDRALLRPGRLETSVYVGLPGLADREAVLAVHARGLPLAADVDLAALAARTRGFSGADLRKVCQDGARNALRSGPTSRR